MSIKELNKQIERIEKIKKSMDENVKARRDKLNKTYAELEKLQGQVDKDSFENTPEFDELYELKIVHEWLKKNEKNTSSEKDKPVINKPVDNGLQVHVVNPGDTIGSIAKKYGVSINDIVKQNKIKDKDLIGIGQKLTIPKNNNPVKKPVSKPKPPAKKPVSKPDNGKYFPVKNSAGVNFWVNSGGSSLKHNMNYGRRTQGKFHSGYDIGMGGNTNVGCHAVRAGKIEAVVDSTGGRGLYIIVDHSSDGYKTLYQHLKKSSSIVKKGDTVKAGQRIATVGNTPANYGYAVHLHIEVSKTGVFGGTESEKIKNTVDPKKYLEVVGDNKTNLPRPK